MPAVIDQLDDVFSKKKDVITDWFRWSFKNSPPFFYNSVDLRCSEYKLAPVDTNLFPGGFNNVGNKQRLVAIEEAKRYFSLYYPNVKKVLLIAEDHTRNKFYNENVLVIREMLKSAGVQVRLSSFKSTDLGHDVVLNAKEEKELVFSPMENDRGILKTSKGFVPDYVLVNNDMSSGAPEVLRNIEQPVVPPVGYGWYKRRKTSHFDTYNKLLKDLCRLLDLDSWLLSTLFHKCGVVNFKEQKGIDCVAKGVDSLIERIKQKYDEYGVKDEPYVFIKSNQGTYGMGVMTARSGDELAEVNKKVRNKMTVGKGGIVNSEVIIQEGVPTANLVDSYPAEPMIYLVNGSPVSCILRYNTKQDKENNLNSSGMAFKQMEEGNNGENVCDTFGLVAKLASFAASWECYVDTYEI